MTKVSVTVSPTLVVSVEEFALNSNVCLFTHKSKKKGIKTYYPDERDYNLNSLAYERKGDGICVAYYNTPKNLHALTPNQQHETFLVLEYARRDPACKVLIWTATGQRAFSSGAAFGVTQVDLDPEVAEAVEVDKP